MPACSPITSAPLAREFMLAGNARFTLVSKRTGTRYTFRVRASDDGKCFFVSTLFGPDNEADYAYLGIIGATGFRVTAKSRFKSDSPQAIAFAWFYEHMLEDNLPSQAEFWHEGCCGRCGRALTVPSSIASGIGPECAKRLAA